MYTGIIRDIGEVISQETVPEGRKLLIRSGFSSECFGVGNSVSVDGVCLTVEKYDSPVFEVTAIHETLEKTNFLNLIIGAKVNLELPLVLGEALAGHFVLGHVDTSAKVIKPAPNLELELSPEMLRFCPYKGSITLNGVSLTIAGVTSRSVRVELIPETLKATNLRNLKPGDLVNVEIDMIARYLDQLKK